MEALSTNEHSWNGRYFKFTVTQESELNKRINDVIARKAFQHYENRKCALGHEIEDWRCAESEVFRLLECGYLLQNDAIELNADAASFAEGLIEICIERRRLAIYAKKRLCRPCDEQIRNQVSLTEGPIFQILNLPFEIDPSRVTAKFKGRILEIKLPKSRGPQPVSEKNLAVAGR